MTDAARLLREIAANPAADVLRLAFADAIEERDGPGDEAWAVFVRVQVWASQCEVCHGERTFRYGDYFCSNCQPHYDRERELWPAVRPVFDGYGWISCLEGSAFSKREAVSPSNAILIVRRGFPAVVRCTLTEWRGGECGRCSGRGSYWPVGREAGGPAPGPWEECPTCHGSGRTPGIGPRLAQAWPVERVEVTDAVIHRSGGNDTYYVGGLGRFPKEFWRALEGHRTASAARAALSAAYIQWARSQVI